jgi:hypothetical protein
MTKGVKLMRPVHLALSLASQYRHLERTLALSSMTTAVRDVKNGKSTMTTAHYSGGPNNTSVWHAMKAWSQSRYISNWSERQLAKRPRHYFLKLKMLRQK